MRNIQRGRMLAAAADTVAEVGYARMTVAQVIARARVSRKSFYDVFADREDCFLAAFEQALSEAILLAKDAYDRESSWREGIRSALSRLLMFMDEQPHLARLVVVESLSAGPAVRRRRTELLGEFAELVDKGRLVTNAGESPPALTAEGVVGCVSGLLYTRLLEQRGEPLTHLLGPLMSMIVLPYAGAQTARRELSRPAPTIAQDGRSPRLALSNDPLEGLDMRLTYRTVRVLTAIAEHPGAGNREIADRSGVADQGQISKLLTRLAGLGLVENIAEGGKKGAPKAWCLTERGARLERLTRNRAG